MLVKCRDAHEFMYQIDDMDQFAYLLTMSA